MTKEYCPFCHLTVAPGDPYRVCHQGQVAHRPCVLHNREQVQAFCEEVTLFLSSCRLPEIRGYWHGLLQSGRLNSYEAIVRALRACLGRIDRWRDGFGEDGEVAWPTTAYVRDWQQRFCHKLLTDL